MALADSTVQQLCEEYLPSRRLPPPKLQNRKIEPGSVPEAKRTVAINRGRLRSQILNTHGKMSQDPSNFEMRICLALKPELL